MKLKLSWWNHQLVGGGVFRRYFRWVAVGGIGVLLVPVSRIHMNIPDPISNLPDQYAAVSYYRSPNNINNITLDGRFIGVTDEEVYLKYPEQMVWEWLVELEVLSKQYESVDVLLRKSWALIILGFYDEAKEVLERASYLAPSSMEVHSAISRLNELMDQ
jgi:hypothetical protein